MSWLSLDTLNFRTESLVLRSRNVLRSRLECDLLLIVYNASAPVPMSCCLPAMARFAMLYRYNLSGQIGFEENQRQIWRPGLGVTEIREALSRTIIFGYFDYSDNRFQSW